MPPDRYYEEIRRLMDERWLDADPDVKDHAIPLLIAFDTAIAFAMSSGIAKFALCQREAKLVGKIVGRDGRMNGSMLWIMHDPCNAARLSDRDHS